MLKQAYKDQRKCYFCGICENYMACAVKDLFSEDCIGCGVCTLACPYEAISLKEPKKELRYIKIYVNGEKFEYSKGEKGLQRPLIRENCSLKEVYNDTAINKAAEILVNANMRGSWRDYK